MKEILSSKNTWIKELKKLQKKKYRDQQNRYLVEGFHLVEEAIRANASVEWILFSKRGQVEWADWLSQQAEDKLVLLHDDAMHALSELPTPPGMIGVIEKQEPAMHFASGSWLLLDAVQDPGNVGTMIRTADACGMTGVVLGEGTADIYQQKVLRAMQGSHFHLPIHRLPLLPVVQQLQAQQIPVYGSAVDRRALAYTDVAPRTSFALVMGNEGQGMQTELLAQTDKNLYIPMRGKAESLNVAIATGILLYHLYCETE